LGSRSRRSFSSRQMRSSNRRAHAENPGSGLKSNEELRRTRAWS
jgi:hypothetical protein